MNVIYVTYNVHHNSIVISIFADYSLQIACGKAEAGLKTTHCSEYASIA